MGGLSDVILSLPISDYFGWQEVALSNASLCVVSSKFSLEMYKFFSNLQQSEMYNCNVHVMTCTCIYAMFTMFQPSCMGLLYEIDVMYLKSNAARSAGPLLCRWMKKHFSQPSMLRVRRCAFVILAPLQAGIGSILACVARAGTFRKGMIHVMHAAAGTWPPAAWRAGLGDSPSRSFQVRPPPGVSGSIPWLLPTRFNPFFCHHSEL